MENEYLRFIVDQQIQEIVEDNDIVNLQVRQILEADEDNTQKFHLCKELIKSTIVPLRKRYPDYYKQTSNIMSSEFHCSLDTQEADQKYRLNVFYKKAIEENDWAENLSITQVGRGGNEYIRLNISLKSHNLSHEIIISSYISDGITEIPFETDPNLNLEYAKAATQFVLDTIGEQITR